MTKDSIAQTTRQSSSAGYVTGAPLAILRLEGLAILILTTLLYWRFTYSWILLAILFLTPDVSFLAYRAGPAIGALIYNILHTYLLPIGLALTLICLDLPLAIPLIWAAHIGFDRMLGYGLKYSDAFPNTRLGWTGRPPKVTFPA